MKLYPVTRTCCPADVTLESAVIERSRGNPPQLRRGKMVHHRFGEARYWHWSDDEVASPFLHCPPST